jgi:type II secretory pathway pseudopilin PulG
VRHALRSCSAERGETLIEILITMVVMALGLVGIVAALGGTIIASDSHRSLAKGEVTVRDYSEIFKDARLDVLSNQPCPTKAQLTPTFSEPGWTITINDPVEYWVPDYADFPNGDWITNRGTNADDLDDGTCLGYYNNCLPDAETALSACDPGLARVSVTLSNARSDAAQATVDVRVVVRRNDAA